MRVKRLFAAVLTAALALSLLVLPASAAPGSFSDVSDPVTAVNADILRLMGVVNGTGNNQFDPNGTLTRAQFCALAIRFLQREEEAQRYATRTIFSDVKSTHWARSYVNMAASVSLSGEENGQPLVTGVGDGRFLPDNQITVAEAVTILLRTLGYSSKQAGAVWPQGYLDLGASIGLTDGLPSSANSSITRAQAAQLFVNALKSKTADGQVYYKTLGTVSSEPTIILAVNVETDDGRSKGAVRTTQNESAESYLPAQGEGNVVALQGKRGELVLNDREEIITFIPDDSTATTITLSGDAQATYLKASGGQQYTVSASTPVYTTAAGQARHYSEAFSTLASGTQVTLYSEKGKIVAVYATSGTTETTSDAVVVMGNATAATFHQLTGGVSSFNIVKNRQSITLSQIKPYDVVTYDQMTNTLVVSDLRLTCVYGDASPNVKTPRTIKAASDEFEVLESAWNTCGDFKIGDSVTLLLTADGKVAGMAKTGTQTRSTAVGFVEGGKVEMFLPNGTSRTMESSLTSSSNLDSQLVTLSLNKNGVSASRISSRTAPGAFQVSGMKLGSYTVSPGVRVYEQVSGGAMAAINLGDLVMESISADKIAAYHLNSSDAVDYIVLNNVTGDAYKYGMMVSSTTTVPAETETDKDGNTTVVSPEHTVTNWKLVRNGEDIEFTSGYSGRSGDMVGVVPGEPMGTVSGDQKTIKAIVQLTEVKNVKPSDFFESQGAQYVTAGGQTYRVANDVECCRNISGNRSDSSNWLTGTGAERLSAIKAYSNDLTIYVDPVGQQVRIIKAN